MIETLFYPLAIALFVLLLEQLIIPYFKTNSKKGAGTPILSALIIVIFIEVILHFIFPNFKLQKTYFSFLSNSNIYFAACFYVIVSSVVIEDRVNNKFLNLLLIYAIPSISLCSWAYFFLKSPIAGLDVQLIIYGLLFCWFLYGLSNLIGKNRMFFLVIILFPISANILSHRISSLQSWFWSFFFSIMTISIIYENSKPAIK